MTDEWIGYQQVLTLLQSVHLIYLLPRVGVHAANKRNAAIAILQF